MRIALTIAGSDSGGGAGIQADLKTFQRFGVFGTSAVTAITAQNTLEVRAVHPVPVAIVQAQLEALAADLPPAAVKTGMLATAEIAAAVGDAIEGYGWSSYVLDPVMVATSGGRLLDPGAEAVLRRRLVPRAAIVTPNLDEAAILAGFSVNDPGTMERAGRALLELGAGAALIKGGHLPGDRLVDVLVTRDGARHFAHDRIQTTSTHGTGCTLSAAITAGLALARPMGIAVEEALAFVRRAIAGAPGLGSGSGPVGDPGIRVSGEPGVP
jgi:hydroxymethylpyrimidine/phosphomethylpyrimidine kinase